MKIKCLHGYFIFTETRLGQVSDFMSRFGQELLPKDDFYTFADLIEAPDFSLTGLSFLDFPAIATFAGKPWEVFEANECVYDFSTGLIVPIDSITQTVRIQAAGNRLISNGLIIPGSLTDEGERIKEYSAWFSRDTQRFQYSEVTYV